jgi:hypothetical protein
LLLISLETGEDAPGDELRDIEVRGMTFWTCRLTDAPERVVEIAVFQNGGRIFEVRGELAGPDAGLLAEFIAALRW